MSMLHSYSALMDCRTVELQGMLATANEKWQITNTDLVILKVIAHPHMM